MGNGEGEDANSTTDQQDGISLDAIPLHSTNLLTLLDEDGVIRYESPAIERIFGFEGDELVGDQVSEYFHPDDRDAVVDAFRTVVASDEHTVETVEYRHERADGTYCWVESAASTNPTPAGYFVVNTRDISDSKRRERELRQTNERLDEYARVLSHDLRNPLQVAKGNLELAIETDDSGYLAEVERAHDRMALLIDDLLELARDGETISATEPVALDDVVADCWEYVETGDATLVTATDRVIRADRSRLRQLLANLVRNAVEYGDPGVTVEVGAFSDGFYVADDGPGIPERERDRVFDVGYSGVDGGTGIGLGIVDRVSQAHDWRVAIVEGSDGGARFEISGVEFAPEA